MKFGKNLEAGIEEKWKMWRPYALRYNEMKRLLPEMNVPSDIQEFKDKDASDRSDTFWKLFDESIQSLHIFYNERLEASTMKLKDLQGRFEKLRSNNEKGNDTNIMSKNPIHDDDDEIDTIESLLQSYSQFQQETILILDFLDINRTACRKILKKYDKRTQSSIKEERMSRLLETHGFLFGGGVMAGIKFKSDSVLHKVKEMHRYSNYNDFAESKKQVKVKVPKYQMLSEEYIKEAQFVLDEVETSNLFSSNHIRQNAYFSRHEIEVGAFLGAGEYGDVHEVKSFHVNDTCPICFLYRSAQQESKSSSAAGEATSESICRPVYRRRSSSHSSTPESNNDIDQKSIKKIITFAKNKDDNKSINQEELEEFEDDHVEEAEELVCSRGFMSDHCIRNGIARYALKEVKPTLKGRALLNGAIDICIEAKFLSVLSHPNIIRLCGTSQGLIKGDPRSFLVLDRLYGTLGDKIESWGKEVKSLRKALFGATRNKNEIGRLWNDRLLAMFDIARAMKYLHTNQIMYRDLKPENAGFDIYGNVKLFDFGLAKELQPKHRIGEDLYRASGRTGTRRYMSPENALCKPYGKSSDVYSFGILLWECLALKQPFESMGIEQHAKDVVMGGKRPEIPKSWPIFVNLLISESWSANRLDRPDFDEICSVLKGELTEREMNLSNRTNDLMNRSITNRDLHRQG